MNISGQENQSPPFYTPSLSFGPDSSVLHSCIAKYQNSNPLNSFG